MKREFEAMEEYWDSKLQEERSFYAEQLILNEEQLTELETRIQDYQNIISLRSKRVELLPTIEEKSVLEQKVTQWEAEIEELNARIFAMEEHHTLQIRELEAEYERKLKEKKPKDNFTK